MAAQTQKPSPENFRGLLEDTKEIAKPQFVPLWLDKPASFTLGTCNTVDQAIDKDNCEWRSLLKPKLPIVFIIWGVFIYNYNDYLKHSKMTAIFYSQFFLKERGNDLG